MNSKLLLAGTLAASLTACGPKIQPIMQNGDYVPTRSDDVVARARAEGEAERARIAGEQGAAMTEALASCAPAVCAAISRGELAIGMTEAQVLAATRTTADAWAARGDRRARVMTGHTGGQSPSDAVGEIAFVNLQDGKVSNYTYREAQGFRTVSSPADATATGRANALAEAMLREGDDFAARGDLAGALDRYDRADVLRPNHPETTLRIARTLDKQLRPLEARMRYQMFLHQMELQKIHAHGQAAAHMADAIAQARQRIIVLERH